MTIAAALLAGVGMGLVGAAAARIADLFAPLDPYRLDPALRADVEARKEHP